MQSEFSHNNGGAADGNVNSSVEQRPKDFQRAPTNPLQNTKYYMPEYIFFLIIKCAEKTARKVPHGSLMQQFRSFLNQALLTKCAEKTARKAPHGSASLLT